MALRRWRYPVDSFDAVLAIGTRTFSGALLEW